ncbi:Cytochrome P450 CYP56F1 [Metarhizium robertsii ARSEF 23]|nr:Cytochrome P450 CYP56F1 [Metarhizium robertsii ARSEF 23]EFY94554.1 Cytochrome P450 CYP56F1 [Metarhizium robertsii ARSEF 23]
MTASLLLGGAILLAITVSGVLFSYFSSPRKGVGGIPTIPLWVALMPLVKDVDQQDVFTKCIEKPLRKHGAASIFFAGQWNVLIHKLAYLAEVFRSEDIYQKSGNYSKIPHSVLAALLGDNIISSRGETWNKLCTRLLSARDSGQLTEKQFRDNVTVLFVAGQENPQLAILSTMYLLAKHPDMQDRLFDELSQQPGKPVDAEYLDSLPLLTSIIYESLRLFPPTGQLINRRVASAVYLGDAIFLPEGTYVGYNCYSTNRDPDAWGQDADAFRPSRWGCSRRDIHREYRRRRTRAEFITFHGGQRECLGEQFAVLQLKATLYTLVTSLRWRLDTTWLDRMTPVSKTGWR